MARKGEFRVDNVPRLSKEQRTLLGSIKTTVWIGKEGNLASVANEIRVQLNKREMVKVRSLLKHLEPQERKAMFEEIARLLSLKLISQQGHTAVYLL